MPRYYFRKKDRIRNEKEFKAILIQRCSAGRGALRLFAAENSLGHSRMGISISKSTGSPIIRNRLKRLAREAFRLNQDKLAGNLDYILIISLKMSKNIESESRDQLSQMSYNSFETVFLELAAKVEQKRNNKTAIHRHEKDKNDK